MLSVNHKTVLKLFYHCFNPIKQPIISFMKELIELGKRIRHNRIASELKQRELSDKSAVSLDSLSALENGKPVTTETLARVLRGLGAGEKLVNLLPPPTISPIDMQKLAGKQRRRVRK